MTLDDKVRAAAFDWLEKIVSVHGEILPRAILQKGFIFDNQQIPLISPQGIFKPAILPEIPLSIVTAPKGPYDDAFSSDGLLRYRYRGTDPRHRDNVGLRLAYKRRVPLIYFHGIEPGKYLASWPVFIVADNVEKLTFTVAVDDFALVKLDKGKEAVQEVADEGALFSRRVYVTRMVRQRIHQQSFRTRVLAAYRERCACCRLRHEQLLDAAHIIPDSEPEGEPLVRNGLALCKLHHAAFDGFFIGITPDYIIEVRKDILDEFDGPMLQHGLKELNGIKIEIPRSLQLQPDRALLEKRYTIFHNFTR